MAIKMSSMSSHQRQTRKIPDAIFGPLGPPSSAFPKKGTNLRTMSSTMPRMAQMAYKVTEKDRVPEFTLKTPF